MPSRYIIDQDELQRACDYLGLTLPVVIRFRNYKHCSARYKNTQWDKKRGVIHRIDVTTYAPYCGYLDACILHELTHAQQCEKFGQHQFSQMYSNQLADIGLDGSAIAVGKTLNRDYEQIRFEQEAMRNEHLRSMFHITKHADGTTMRRTFKMSNLNLTELIDEL